MKPTREVLLRYAAGMTLFYLGLILILNHAMLTGDYEGLRIWFYIMVAAVPTGIIGTWRVLARTHRGEQEDEAIEGPVLISIALGFAGVVWGVSTLFY